MALHRLRGTGQVKVVRKQHSGVDHVEQLDERAGLAQVDVQWIPSLRGELFARRQEGVGQRLRSQRKEQAQIGVAADSAGLSLMELDVHRADGRLCDFSRTAWERRLYLVSKGIPWASPLPSVAETDSCRRIVYRSP